VRGREKYAVATAAPRAYAGFRSTWTTVDGVPVHARVGPADRPGPPLVLVHGLAVSHRYLMPVATLLARRHPVLVPDLPGFGLSGDPGTALGVRASADALGGWLRATGTGPAVLLGNSYGCQVIVDLVVREPAAAPALVLAGPTVDPAARSAVRQALRWLRDVRHEDLRQTGVIARDVRDAGPGRILATLRHAVADRTEDKLPLVEVPTLVTRGGAEPIVPQRWAEVAAGLLPRGELVVLPGAPHNANYSAADALATVTESFLDRALRPAGDGSG
jgi:pimeloyl-ACP methyl ester carboxylesterase